MGKKFEVVAVTGKYTDQSGQEKSRYMNIGSILTTRNGGFMLKLESVPIGWDGWAYLNEPKPRDPAQQRPAAAAPAPAPARSGNFEDMNDDAPF